MKRILIAFIILVLFYSCSQTPEQKAQKVITNYLQKNIDDWKSYESIEFGNLDSSYSLFDEDYKIIITDSVNSSKIFNAQMELFNFYLDEHETSEAQKVLLVCDSVARESKRADSLLITARKEWKSIFNGWHLMHKYRAKNLNGNYKLHNVHFEISKDFSSVDPIYDLGN